MELAHESSNVATTIVDEKLLVKQTVLLVVVEFETTTFLTAKHATQGLINEALRADGQVLFKVVVKGDTVVRILEKLDVLLEVLKVQLLLNPIEQCFVSLVSLKTRRLYLEEHNCVFRSRHTGVKFLDLVSMGVKDCLVGNRGVLKFLTIVRQSASVLDNQLIAVVNF